MYIHIVTDSCIYLDILTYTYIYLHIPTYTYIYLQILTYTSYAYIYIHILTYTYIYLHIPAYTYMLTCFALLLCFAVCCDIFLSNFHIIHIHVRSAALPVHCYDRFQNFAPGSHQEHFFGP